MAYMTCEEEFLKEYEEARMPKSEKHGVDIKMFKDRPAYVRKAYEEFVAEQMRLHPNTFKITAQSQSAYPMGVVLYVSYEY